MALAALEKLLARGVIQKQERVVVISTAHGLKFTDFKVRYHQEALEGIQSSLANPEIVLKPRYETVRDEIFRQIEARLG